MKSSRILELEGKNLRLQNQLEMIKKEIENGNLLKKAGTNTNSLSSNVLNGIESALNSNYKNNSRSRSRDKIIIKSSKGKLANQADNIIIIQSS